MNPEILFAFMFGMIILTVSHGLCVLAFASYAGTEDFTFSKLEYTGKINILAGLILGAARTYVSFKKLIGVHDELIYLRNHQVLHTLNDAMLNLIRRILHGGIKNTKKYCKCPGFS